MLSIGPRRGWSVGWLVTGLLGLLVAGPAAAQSFVEFESGQVRPLALSPDATKLFAVNTPDDRLELFNVVGGGLAHTGAIPVGLEPVAVAARTNTEVWVVNHLSDSISIIDLSLSPPRVVKTLLTCDEPRDIVFAGTRAFVTTARRGQNCPVAANLSSEGIGRAVVQVFDGPSLGGAGMGGTPAANIVLFGDTPRALAVAPGGGTVYAAVFHSGNQTTTINEGIVCNGGSGAAPCNLDGVTMPGGLAGGQVPGGLPAPSPLNCSGQSQPETGLIVRFDPATGIWKDPLSRNWNNAVRFSLPDQDVFAIDVPSLTATGTPWAHVGTVLFNMAVNPSGKIYVTNTEARNEVRFEGPGTCSTTVRGHLHEARITVLDGAAVLPRHLNKHLDSIYNVIPTPATEQAKSFAIPLGLAVNGAGTTVYVAAFGSSQVGIFDAGQLETNTFTPTAANHIDVTGGGPSGLVLNETQSRLYVFTRFDNAVSIINTTTNMEIGHLPLFNPEPLSVVDGRPFLYDAVFTSSNGEASCASCHIFGDFDSLAWDLGNPSDANFPNPNPFRVGGSATFASMKGPMTTQTLRGMAHSGPMHWRGDRTGGSSGGDPLDEHAAFEAFNVAFDGLLGRGSPIPAGNMDAFTDFILQVMLPPNPIRPLDGIPVGSPAALGRTQFLDATDITDLVQHCEGCHALDAAQGFFGTDGFMSFENETQDFKIPHLRNMYQKIGMFGMPQSPFIKNGNNGDQGPQVRGFGFLHDGSIDTVFRFHRAQVFNLTIAEAQNMEQFMFQFDSDLAPVVGQQVTKTSASPASVDTRIAVLLARDNAGECEVVVKGPKDNEERGWYRDASGNFVSDRAGEGPIAPNDLRDQALIAGQERTYTCVPVGSGERIGVDRDLDGCFDNDELHDGSDPADASSNGCLATTTTTTSSPTTTTTLPPLCDPTPAVGCRGATPAKTKVQLKDNANDAKDVFKWKWRGGNTVTADFKDPVNGSATYRFCVYDGSGATQPLLEAGVLPGGTCGSKPCWKPSSTTGFKMSNKAATPSGIRRLKFREGIDPKAKIILSAMGVNVPMPSLGSGLTLPVTVQLLIDDGIGTECWQATYTTAQRNDATQFRAKGP